MRTITRAALAALALSTLVSCDTRRNITGIDQGFPSVSVSVAAQNDSVDVNSPMSLTVIASDNLSLQALRVFMGTDTLVDTVFTSATPQYSKTVDVSLTGIQSGTVLQVQGAARDGAGNVSLSEILSLVAFDRNAPTIIITSPSDATIFRAGDSTTITIVATDSSGIARVGYQILQIGPTTTDTVQSDSVAVTNAPFTATRSFPTQIPTSLTPGNYVIRGFARDVAANGGLGAQTVSFTVADTGAIANDSIGPIVSQVVRDRLEVDDSVRVSANDLSGVTYVGFQLNLASDSSLIRRDSVAFAGNRVSEAVTMPLNLAAAYAGEGIIVRGFAYDANGNIGYVAPAGATPPSTDVAAASDTTEIVYGRTFALPDGGIAADIEVDLTHNRAYVSNLTFDRLDVWEQGSQAFATKTVAVGSDPWGLFVDNSGDTLLVANSGGTNISRVSINHANVNSVAEVASRRIKTPNTYIADITASVDDAGTARFEVEYFDYSDRPQFVAQSANGDIYFSTKPTSIAPDGTIRRFVAGPGPFHDVQQLFQYGTTEGSGHVAVINADQIIILGGVASSDSDLLRICDHAENQNPATTTVCVDGIDPGLIVDSLVQFHGSDASAVSNLDVPSLGLSDTTFVAAGGDGRWIAFGEGSTEEAGRVMMVQDQATFFSPSILVSDLVNNASDRVFGLAINSNSSVAGVHGEQSFLFEVESPFHLRLQGSATTFSQGAGIAFHPNNMGDLSPPDARVAFVAASNGTIEIVDTFHYLKRGSLPVRANLYGPIRVTLPMPGDDPAVVLKLFGLTSEGLIVIDIRASDILPLP